MLEKYIDWLIAKIQIDEAYHNHKETSAWAGAAIYLGGVLYFAFAARSIIDDCCEGKILATVFILIIAALVFAFVGWQYGRKRIAEDRIKCYEKVLGDAFKEYENCQNKGKLEKYIEGLKRSEEHGKPSHLSEPIVYTAIAIATVTAIIIVCWTECTICLHL